MKPIHIPVVYALNQCRYKFLAETNKYSAAGVGILLPKLNIVSILVIIIVHVMILDDFIFHFLFLGL